MAKKLTVKQAAEAAGVGLTLMYQWIGSRQLSHYRLGCHGRRGKIVIDEADLHAFLEDRRVDAVVETANRTPALVDLKPAHPTRRRKQPLEFVFCRPSRSVTSP